MPNGLIRKGLVFSVIVLFIGVGIVPSFNAEVISIVKKTSNLQSNGVTIYVGGSGPGNYTKIQDAIDNASDGDTVFVYGDSSPYYEQLDIEKRINLIGENKYTTIIDGLDFMMGVYLGVDGITISGFTVQNTTTDYAGICYNSDNNLIIDNIIKKNDYGIGCGYYGAGNVISNNIIVDNQFGIDTQWSEYNNISYNTIENNTQGVATFMGGYNKIFLNNFYNNPRFTIMIVMSRGDEIFKNNFFGSTKTMIMGEVLTETWDMNYWGRPRIIPKFLMGLEWRWIYLEFGFFFPKVRFDWHPALKPYDIPDTSYIQGFGIE